MAKLTDIEMLERNLIKAARSQVRLKHSLAADRELNELLPALKKDLEKAIKEGTAKEFVLAAISGVSNAV